MDIPSGPTRRERLRSETITEIKASARQQLIMHGVSGVSLRSIAREVGVTPAALYRYFDSLDALIVELRCDFWDELTEATVQAMEDKPAQNHLSRMRIWIRTFRSWANAHTREFELMLNGPGGLPTPSALGATIAQLDELEPVTAKATQHARLWGQELSRFWQQLREPVDYAREPAPDLSPELAAEVRAYLSFLSITEDIPIFLAYRIMSSWVRILGMVTLEAFGTMPVRENIDEFYEVEVTSVLASMMERLAEFQKPPQQNDLAPPEELPISIWLGDGRNHEAVEAALTQFLLQKGFEPFGHRPPVIGSWFRRFWARAKKETAHLTPSRLGAEAERKVRIEVFDKDQAAIDNLVATGMAALITSLQGETDACVRAGAILVLKVNGRLFSTTLFQYQLAWLERNPELVEDPEGLWKGLKALGTREPQSASSQTTDALTSATDNGLPSDPA